MLLRLFSIARRTNHDWLVGKVSENWTPEQQKILIQFGQRLKKLRKEAGLTQNELAERVQLQRSYISDSEAGRRNIALLNVYKIALSLGVTMSHLLDITPDDVD
jgi:DNA-binding XRE family transcriptional regulator